MDLTLSVYLYNILPYDLAVILGIIPVLVEPRREKTGLRGFRPGPTQTGLYTLRKELEA